MRRVAFFFIKGTLLFSCTGLLNAQVKQPEYTEKKPSVAVIARSKGDSVMIRWAPDDPLLWKAANKYGYRVVRIKVAENDKLLFGANRTIVVIADSIRPYPIAKIEPLIETDKYAAIVGQAIYGEDFEVSASFDKNPSAVFNKARELEDRFSFALFAADQSSLAARVHGLWFTDRNVNINDKYLYTVYPLLPIGIMEFDTAYTVIAVNDTVQLPKPYDFKASFGDKYVELSWNREYLQRFYTSYIVERSDDNGITYAPTTESPFLNISEKADEQAEYFYRVDSLPENNIKYFYRIRGISPFGEKGPPSDVLSGVGIGKSDFINPIITKNEITGGTSAYLEWEIMENFSADVYGFEVAKSQNADGPYISVTPAILDKQIRSYSDPVPYKSGYYRVAAFDKSGEKHYSFPAMVLLPDSLPPAMPANIKGTVDSLGIVTLSWNANTEDDLAGYRIFRSNYADDGYVKINNEQIIATSFNDTLSLRVLSKNVYYKLAAIDKHYNESELTNALTIIRPDTIPPAPPVFRNYMVTDSSIVVYWNNSPSEDVKDHLLFRRKAGETAWKRINPVNDTTEWYNDKDVVNQTVYQYIIIAADKTGLESKPGNPIEIRATGAQNVTATIKKLNARANLIGKTILITWEPAQTQRIAKYALYRAVDNEPIILYRTLDSNQRSFSDDNVNISHNYHYRIQAITSDGIRSVLSPEAVVNF
jgi:fibronectin type 3 domain-containing protein